MGSIFETDSNRDLFGLQKSRWLDLIVRRRGASLGVENGLRRRFINSEKKAYKWLYALGKWADAVFSSFRLPKWQIINP